jgi:hypothetical protein
VGWVYVAVALAAAPHTAGFGALHATVKGVVFTPWQDQVYCVVCIELKEFSTKVLPGAQRFAEVDERVLLATPFALPQAAVMGIGSISIMMSAGVTPGPFKAVTSTVGLPMGSLPALDTR